MASTLELLRERCGFEISVYFEKVILNVVTKPSEVSSLRSGY
jgi:hypothetical protein